MAFESYDDLGDFFGLDDFAIQATYVKTGNPNATVLGIFDNPQVSQGVSEHLDITIPAPKFVCRTADIATVEEGDQLIVNSVTYYIRVQANDGEGVSTLYLERV